MNQTSFDWLEPFERKFVGTNFKIVDSESIKPFIVKLLSKKLQSVQETIKWLEDYSELEGVIGEDLNRRYVAMTCDTKDKEKEENYIYFIREIQPKFTEWTHSLKKNIMIRLIASNLTS